MFSINVNATSANPANTWGLSFTNYMTTAFAYSFTVPISKLALGKLLGSVWAAPAAYVASPIVVPIVLTAAPFVAAIVVNTAGKTATYAQQTLVKRQYRDLANTQELSKSKQIDLSDEEDTVLVEVRTEIEVGESERESMVKALKESNFNVIDQANVHEALKDAREISKNVQEVLTAREILDSELPDLT